MRGGWRPPYDLRQARAHISRGRVLAFVGAEVLAHGFHKLMTKVGISGHCKLFAGSRKCMLRVVRRQLKITQHTFATFVTLCGNTFTNRSNTFNFRLGG